MSEHSNIIYLFYAMGRPRLKSKNEILDACRDLFWRQGYYKTSIKDIEKATGMKPGSVYYQFKDKQTIFEQTLNHYIDTVIRLRADQYLFATSGNPKENIMGFFESVFRVNENKRYGCLMVSSSIVVPEQPWIRQLFDEMIDLIERGFLFQLDRVNDDACQQIDKTMVARQLTLINHGFWSMVQIDGSDQHIKSYLNSIRHLVR